MRAPRHRQQGIVVLLILLVVLSAGSYVLLRSLNAAIQRNRDEQTVTAASLRTAERALIGYALRYPDNPDDPSPNAGPGHLPCPDTRFDAGDVPGQSDPPCALSSSTETGLFPWRTLDTSEVRDGSGAPLWYAVADGFRSNPSGVINPSTLAALRLDDCTAGGRELAAILFAPGPALDAQNRSTASAVERFKAANYLEGQNASRGDACFTSAIDATRNDIVRAVGRAELSDALQQRVLADIAKALQRYYEDPDGDDIAGVDADCVNASLPADCDNAYPWLSPYANPASAAYVGVPGTRAGQLPLRRKGLSFNAPFSAAWNVPTDGSVATTGSAPPASACLRSTASVCSVQPTGFLSPVTLVGPVLGSGVAPFGAGFCNWPGGTALHCETTVTLSDPGGSGNVLSRAYVIEIGGLPRRLVPPSTGASRTEGVSLATGALASGASIHLKITDTLLPPSAAAEVLGDATLNLTAGMALADFTLLGVPYDLEVDDDEVIDNASRRSPGELPQWLVANDWQQFIVVAYAAAYAPGNPAADCTSGTDCLFLTRELHGQAASTSDAVHAVVLSGGAALSTQVRPSADPAQVFEDENSSFDDRYSEKSRSATFNDRLRRVDAE